MKIRWTHAILAVVLFAMATSLVPAASSGTSHAFWQQTTGPQGGDGLTLAVNASGHVFVGDKDVAFEIRAFQLFIVSGGVETFFGVVLFPGGDLLKLTTGNVLVRDHQSIGRNKCARATIVEPNRRQSEVFEPCVGWCEVVPLFPLLARGIIKRPHALVGEQA